MLAVIPPSMSSKPKINIEKPSLECSELVLLMVQPPVLSAMKPDVITSAAAKKPNTACTVLVHLQ